MSPLQEAEQLLSNMTRAEKAQLLQWVARDLGDAFPGIDSIPGVSGGEPCIVRTRIPVWVLVQARRLGTSEADLLRSYPTLRAEDLANGKTMRNRGHGVAHRSMSCCMSLERRPRRLGGCQRGGGTRCPNSSATLQQ